VAGSQLDPSSCSGVVRVSEEVDCDATGITDCNRDSVSQRVPPGSQQRARTGFAEVLLES
jgi:hypothetical protein